MFSRKFIYSIVSRLLALALLAAGLLKGRDLLLGAYGEQGFWGDRRVLTGIASLEIAFGLWLFIGLFPRPTRWLAVICFGSFLCFAAASALAGESSCDCFGASLAVSPWYTASFDLFAVVALMAGGPGPLSVPTRRSVRFRFAAFAILLLTAVGGGLWAAYHFAPVPLGDEGDIQEGASVLALDPAKWTGRRLPLLRHIDIGAQLGYGHWIVMIYRRDCPLCREAVPHYVELAYELADRAGAPRVALIELPPFEGVAKPSYPQRMICARGRLSAAKHWAINTPWFIALKEGNVTTATQSSHLLLGNPLGLSSSPVSLTTRLSGDASAKGILFPNYRKARREFF